MFSSFFKNSTDATEEEDEKPLECNYDTDLITLYQALEEQAWIPALDLIETDSQESRDQVRTWVTRYEKNGSVRWSQLPIHAAMIFNAPFKIVKALVDAYPKGVRCTDDQHMLPLHLAFRYGVPDNTLLLLLEAFPGAMNAKNRKGRVPALCACPESPYRSKIVRYHIDNAKQLLLEDRPMAKQVSELEAKLEEQTKQTEELEAEKEAWTAREAELKQEISNLEEKLALATKKEEVKEETRDEPAPVGAILTKDVPLMDTDNASVNLPSPSAASVKSVKSVKSTSGMTEKTSTSKATAQSTSGATEKTGTSKATAKSGATEKTSTSKDTAKSGATEKSGTSKTSTKSATTTKTAKSSKSTKSSKSMRSLGSKILHLGRKRKPTEAEVSPAAE
jgi:hypothetical protein